MKKKVIIFLSTSIYLILVELVTRLFMNMNPFPRYFFYELSFILGITSIMFLFKSNKVSRRYAIGLVVVFGLLFFGNRTMFLSSNDFLYIRLLQYMNEAIKVGHASTEFVYPSAIIGMILIVAIFVVIQKLINKFVKDSEIVFPHYHRAGALLTVTIFVFSFFINLASTVTLAKTNKNFCDYLGIESGGQLVKMETKYFKKSSFDKFGMVSYYYNEARVVTNTANVELKTREVPTEPQKNEYTGLLKGYNVVNIMLETGIRGCISKELTPNMYALMHNGIDFVDNYSKNKTGVSEHIGIVGSYPTYGIKYNSSATTQKIDDLKIDFSDMSVPLMLKKEGYTTKFFHNGAGMYGRSVIIPQMGFDEYNDYYKIDSGEPLWHFDGSYILDSSTASVIKDQIYDKDHPFYTFWTTLSSHGPYNEEDGKYVKTRNEYFAKKGYFDAFDKTFDTGYYSQFAPLDADEYSELRHLIAAFMDLDEGIGMLVNSLKEQNLFDKTLFVFYGDHEAYYENLSGGMLNIKDEKPVEQYHTELFMSNPTLTKKYKELNKIPDNEAATYKTFSSPYDIAPTTLDLLGVKYNQRNYYSDSAFNYISDMGNVFYSTEKQSFITDEIYAIDPDTIEYNNSTQEDADEFSILALDKLNRLQIIDDLYNKRISYEK